MARNREAKPRSHACNATLVAYFRQRKGWTQKELAAASGYSERLINKAESGRPISTSAIDVLAEALSTPEGPVAFEDLVSDPLALAKAYMAGLYVHQKNIIGAIRHFLDEDIVFRIAGDPNLIPFAGEYRGIAEMERGFEIFYSIMEVPKDHDYEACFTYIAQGLDVVVVGDSWIHPIGVPLDKPVHLSHRMKFRKGKLYHFEDVYDTLSGAQSLEKARAATNGELLPI